MTSPATEPSPEIIGKPIEPETGSQLEAINNWLSENAREHSFQVVAVANGSPSPVYQVIEFICVCSLSDLPQGITSGIEAAIDSQSSIVSPRELDALAVHYFANQGRSALLFDEEIPVKNDKMDRRIIISVFSDQKTAQEHATQQEKRIASDEAARYLY